VKRNDGARAVEASENVSDGGEVHGCEMVNMKEDSKPDNTVNLDSCDSHLVDQSVSLQKEIASPHEVEGSCTSRQDPVEWHQGSESDEASGEEDLEFENDEAFGEEEIRSENDDRLGEEELRQLLGEWPETETEESCSEHDIDGDGDHQAPFENDQVCLDGCSTTAAGSCSTPAGRGRGRRNRRRARTRRRARARRNEAKIQDNWMVPFEKLMKDSSCVAWHPAHEVALLPPLQQFPPPAAGTLLPGAVCIWKAPSDGSANAGGSAGHLRDGEVATLCDADNTKVACESAGPNSAEAEPFLSKRHRDESDPGSTSADEVTRKKSGFRLRRRTGRWADDESGEEWELDDDERRELLADLDEEERCRLLGEFPDTTDDEGCDWEKEDKEIFTDGQKVFQSVPSATGQSLFTDGEQLYAAVCVMVSPPSPTSPQQ